MYESSPDWLDDGMEQTLIPISLHFFPSHEASAQKSSDEIPASFMQKATAIFLLQSEARSQQNPSRLAMVLERW